MIGPPSGLTVMVNEKKPAAQPLCVDGPSDVGKNLRVRGEPESKTIGKLCAF